MSTTAKKSTKMPLTKPEKEDHGAILKNLIESKDMPDIKTNNIHLYLKKLDKNYVKSDYKKIMESIITDEKLNDVEKITMIVKMYKERKNNKKIQEETEDIRDKINSLFDEGISIPTSHKTKEKGSCLCNVVCFLPKTMYAALKFIFKSYISIFSIIIIITIIYFLCKKIYFSL